MAYTGSIAKERVGNGIRFLDDNYPDFREYVDPDQVIIRSATQCMLVRASRMDITVAATKHALQHADLVRLAFSIPKDNLASDWDLLQIEWMKQAFGIGA